MMVQRAWSPAFPAEILELFQTQGLTLLGVAPAVAWPEKEREYRAWLAEGRHGTMAWMERHAPLKYNPELIHPGTKSLLFVGLNYFQPEPAGLEGQGRIARYAWGRDYHKVLGKRLLGLVKALQERYPGQTFRYFTDTSPLDERWYAEQSGISFTGKNRLSISSHFGSWFFLGEIFSPIEFPPSQPEAGRHGGCPASCRKCQVACPTGALRPDGTMDASRCISFLTIEHDGPIPVDLRRPLGDWLFGCDLCQSVCPLNLRSVPTTEPDFLNWKAGPGRSPLEILQLESQTAFEALFAGSPVMRAGLRQMKRNACIVAGNLKLDPCLPELKKLADGPDDLLAEHARWALAQWGEPVIQGGAS